MKITIKPTSKAVDLIKELEVAEFRHRAGIRKGLFDIGFDAARQAEIAINNNNKSGRIYEINDLPHTASAPGETPANMTGTLKKSTNYVVRGDSEVEWGSTAGHAVFLEEGTDKMKARPWLRKIASDLGDYHAGLIEQRVNREIKRHS